MRDGVRRLLADTADIRVVAEATTGADAVKALDGTPVDIVLLDVSMPQTSFADTVREMRRGHPSVRVVVLSAFAEEEYAVRALKAGAAGYVTKERTPEELVEAIRAAAAGRRFISPSVGELLAAEAAREAFAPARGKLSDRELEVLRLLGGGASVKEVAAQLRLSPKTVSTYRARLLEKLGIRTTADLVRYVIQNRLA